MKKSRIIPLIALLLLFGIAAYSLIPWNSAPPKSVTIPATAPEPPPEPAVAVAPVEPPPVTNPPVASVAPAPAAPEKFPETPAPTKPEPKPVVKVVEMPATVPQPPAKFYTAEMAANRDYSLRFRAGYQHANHGDNNDTVWLSAKFSANGDSWRQRAGKNAWLVPDADAEFSHQDLAKKSTGANAGSAEGVRLEASLFWPWQLWTLAVGGRTNDFCPYGGPLALALGPTVNGGFDELFDGTSPQLFSHGGARLTINRDGFIEYTFGGAENLGGVRQQLVGELPLYRSRDGRVRYVVRGVWDHTTGNQADLVQGAFLVEMPLAFLATPSQWNDLIPFRK